MQLPFISGSYNLDSRPASVQRTINMVPVPLEPGNERAPWVFKDVPGLVAAYPAEGSDPFFADVLFLLNGQQGLTKDSSIYDRAMTATGSVAINSSKTLNGLPTYEKPYGSGITDHYLQLTVSDSWVSGNLTVGEWCLEMWLNPTASGAQPECFSIGPLSIKWFADESVQGVCSNIGGGSVGASSAVGALPIGTWGHIAFIRDNTTDPLFTILRLFFNGVEAASSGGIGKTATLGGSGLGRALGYTSNSPGFSSGGVRLTMSTRRYLSNEEGDPVSSFTPDEYPFPSL